MGTLEYAQMVLEDATDWQPPSLGLTLTTARATTSAETFRRDHEQVRRFLKREVAGYQGLAHIEFTTGQGKRSGGHRRIHAHELVKTSERLTEGDVASIQQGAAALWERRTGAHRVELAELRTAAGAAHYLTHHHGKRAQLPPAGWKGRRYRPTRGYFALPAPERRLRAREALLDKNLQRRVKATLLADEALVEVLDGDEWNELLVGDLEQARATAAEGVQLVRVMEVPTAFDDNDLPCAWEVQVLGPAIGETL
jgi:hypothetical protein